MAITQRDKQHNKTTVNVLFVLTAIYFFYGYFEPYLNQIVGPLMRFYIIALALFYLIHAHFKIKQNHLIRYYVIWFVYLCVTLLWARNYEVFQTHFLTLLGTILLLISVTNIENSDDVIEKYIYMLWIGSFLVGFISLFMHSAYRVSFSARQVLTILGVQTDPNNQACFLMFGISISLYFIIIRKQMIIPGMVTIVINMFSMMMTASRGGIVAVAAMLIIILLFVIKDTKTKIWGIIGVAAVTFIIFRYSDAFVSVASMERLVGLDEYEGGGHRVEIWKSALQLVNENPLFYLFGAGWGSYYTYNGWLGMHNTYLESFCNTGLIGLFLFYYPILKSSIYLWKKERYLPIFIILPILIASFFLDSINKRYFWNSILVLFLFYFNERGKDYSSI